MGFNGPIRSRRGSVPAEYAALAGLVGVISLGAFTAPEAFADLLLRSSANMTPPTAHVVTTGPSATPGGGDTTSNPSPSTPPSDPGDPGSTPPTGGTPEGGDPWTDDPPAGDPTGGTPPGGDPTGGTPPGGDPTGGVPDTSTGSIGVMLLTLTQPNLPEDVAAGLVDAIIQELSDDPYPSILVVQDDYHHYEDAEDTKNVVTWMEEAGYDVSYMSEPSDGLKPADIDGADLVWLSNPGWPTDDNNTLTTLWDAANNGVDIVLQGDDMTFTHAGQSGTDTLNDLTGADHISNGTRTGGVRTDNNQGENYSVSVSGTDGTAFESLEGEAFLYGNDIDHSRIEDDENIDIYAWAELDGSDGSSGIFPVVWIHDLE